MKRLLQVVAERGSKDSWCVENREILRVGEHFKRRENRSSVWGNILKRRRDPQSGGTF